MNGNKMQLTPILTAMVKKNHDKGDLIKVDFIEANNGELALYIADLADALADNEQAQQFLLLSDMEIKADDCVFDNMDMSIFKCEHPERIDKAIQKRIEAAYPAIDGLPQIHTDFMKLFCENGGKGKVWCEMEELSICCNAPVKTIWAMNVCCEKCEKQVFDDGDMLTHYTPLIKDGFIVLDMKPKDAMKSALEQRKEKMENMQQPTPADAQGEVMSAKEWHDKEYRAGGMYEFMRDYAKYYHAMLSKQPEQTTFEF